MIIWYCLQIIKTAIWFDYHINQYYFYFRHNLEYILQMITFQWSGFNFQWQRNFYTLLGIFSGLLYQKLYLWIIFNLKSEILLPVVISTQFRFFYFDRLRLFLVKQKVQFNFLVLFFSGRVAKIRKTCIQPARFRCQEAL